MSMTASILASSSGFSPAVERIGGPFDRLAEVRIPEHLGGHGRGREVGVEMERDALLGHRTVRIDLVEHAGLDAAL